MEHDITLKWRPGTQPQLPDATPRLPNKGIVIEDFDDSFPGDESLPNVYKRPQGPVLDGVHLETVGVEDVDGSSTQSLTVLAAVALTPADPSEADNQQAKLVIAPDLPVVVMLDCEGGDSILASEGLVTVRGAVDEDWIALECIKTNGLNNDAKLLRMTTGSQECLIMSREVKPDVVVGDAWRRLEGIRDKEGLSGPSSLAQADIASDARVFIPECLGNPLRTTEWNDEILPALKRESYIVDKAEILASQVEIPWKRKRTFVVEIKGGLATKVKLAVWKRRLEKVKQPVQELGKILRRGGAYFLKRGNGERAIYSFNEPSMSLNRAHIMGQKPTEGYIAHPADVARLEEAEELHFNDDAKITTGQKRYVILQTVSKSAAANLIADLTSPPMLRAVLVELAVQGLQGKTVPEVAELEGLACMVFEDYLAASKAFEVTRAVTRSQAKATPQAPEVVWEAEPPLPEEKEMENETAQTVTTAELPVEVDRPRKRRGQREPIPRT